MYEIFAKFGFVKYLFKYFAFCFVGAAMTFCLFSFNSLSLSFVPATEPSFTFLLIVSRLTIKRSLSSLPAPDSGAWHGREYLLCFQFSFFRLDPEFYYFVPGNDTSCQFPSTLFSFLLCSISRLLTQTYEKILA